MSGEAKSTFFRQSAWMMVATTAGGVLMTAVHTVARRMDAPGTPAVFYTDFYTLLKIFLLLGIPTAGLQTIFTQQSAAAVTPAQSRQLATAVRAVAGVAFSIWLVMAVILLLCQNALLGWLKINSPVALWVTMLVVLVSLCAPIMRGLLQGHQDFAGLGWVAILDGAGRFTAVCIIVLLLQGKAAGAMTGALIGQIGAAAVALWLTRKVVFSQGEAFVWREWLGRVIPLTFGAGALVFIQNVDAVFVKGTFSEAQAAFYPPAAMVGFALVQFTGPITAVMYPKIVRSVARGEKTDALKLTLLTTVLVGGCGSLVATAFPELPIRIIYFTSWKDCVASAPIVPWFSWCMTLMVVAVVLINNLLARERFKVVPWMLLLAGAYVGALYLQKPHLLQMETLAALIRVVQTLGLFSLCLLVLAAWFTWGKPAGEANRPR